METKYTPGPWQVDKCKGELHIITEKGTAALASLYCDPMDEETTANAYLIAGAPDLLKALQDLYDETEWLRGSMHCPTLNNNIFKQAESAINKSLNQSL